MNFESWIDALIDGDTRRTAAKKAGYAQSTLSRQLDRGKLLPEMVIALCRAYDRSPVQGLVETGYINEYEVEGVDLAIALHDATNEQLLNEIMRRSDPEARYLFGADGDSEVVDLDDAGDAAVFDIQKARVDPSDYDDGTVREFDYDESEYAADSSPNEQEEREKRGEDLID